MGKNHMLASKVAIATTTWYRPDVESDVLRSKLAKKTIRKAIGLGYDVVVVDGGSSEEFLKELEGYGAKVYAEELRGMGKGRRQVLKLAYETGKEIIAWIEPEKDSVIPELFKAVLPIVEGSADLVIPKRRSLETYPLLQQYAENMGNLFWKDLTGHDLDMWIGVRVFKRELVNYFLDYKGEYGDEWDSIFIPVMDAIVDGKTVKGVEINYVHPKEQTEIEEHDLQFHRKRLEQLNNFI
ncbi:MAG: hypothetical protein ABIB71_01185, partial [Candidatus Woesearchaeota archaeon]